jgi:predicted Rossmann-fold nucleotide-binding protein
MDELFETLTLIQTKTINKFPIVLYGKEYFDPLMKNIDWWLQQGTISKEDLELVLLTDDVQEAIEHIRHYITTNYKLKPRKKFWWLFEKK